MFAAAGAGFPGVAVLHLIVYAAFKAPLFFAAGIAHERVETFDLRRMRLGRAMPWVAAMTGLAALALAGVPPLGGAWSKEEVVKALAETAPWLPCVARAAGALSAAYATRFALMSFGPGRAGDGDAGGGEGAALAALSLATLALSALWLPAVHDAAARLVGAELSPGTRAELVASLALLALGVSAGIRLAHRPGEAPVREWLGLAAAIDAVAVRPFEALAARSARIDDGALDAVPRGAAEVAKAVSGLFASTDDAVLDAIPRGAAGAAGAAKAVSGLFGRADDNVIDGLRPGLADRGVEASGPAGHGGVGLATWLTGLVAGVASRGGERVADLIPDGTGRASGTAGAGLRRLQTGQSHHYYLMLIAGFAAGAAIVMLGA